MKAFEIEIRTISKVTNNQKLYIQHQFEIKLDE